MPTFSHEVFGDVLNCLFHSPQSLFSAQVMLIMCCLLMLSQETFCYTKCSLRVPSLIDLATLRKFFNYQQIFLC